MDHKALENMSNSELLVEIDEIESERDDLRVLHEEAVKARDNLSAELERVKAELEEANKNVQLGLQFYKSLVEKNAELTSLKSRLPKNADGDVVLPGVRQWIWRGGKTLPSDDPRIVYSIGEESVDFGSNGGYCHISSCFSTAESCRAAAEGGETNG